MFSHITSSLKKLGLRSRDVGAGRPLVTVFGATGAQGGSVALELMESNRYRVRGVTRSPESERAKKLREGGVEVVQADMGNREEVMAALQGAYAAYVVTDFWTVREREFEMGKLTVECAKEAGVQHLIWSTLPDTAALSGGAINVPHFVSKAKVDAVVESLGFEHHTFLMCSFYYQNFTQFGFTVAQHEEGEGAPQAASGTGTPAAGVTGAEVVAQEGEGKAGAGAEGKEGEGKEEGGRAEGVAALGAAIFRKSGAGEPASKAADVAPKDTSPVAFRLPLEARDMLTAFDADDTGGAVLAILDNPGKWQGKRVCLAGFHAPAAEYARLFQKVKKRPTTYETIPADNEEFREMFKWFAEKTVFGPYDITNGRQCYPKLKSWEEWLEASDWDGPTRTAAEAPPVEEGPKKAE